jgi:hypothetical protein
MPFTVTFDLPKACGDGGQADRADSTLTTFSLLYIAAAAGHQGVRVVSQLGVVGLAC